VCRCAGVQAGRDSCVRACVRAGMRACLRAEGQAGRRAIFSLSESARRVAPCRGQGHGQSDFHDEDHHNSCVVPF
jgi:hypothetical protein